MGGRVSKTYRREVARGTRTGCWARGRAVGLGRWVLVASRRESGHWGRSLTWARDLVGEAGGGRPAPVRGCGEGQRDETRRNWRHRQGPSSREQGVLGSRPGLGRRRWGRRRVDGTRSHRHRLRKLASDLLVALGGENVLLGLSATLKVDRLLGCLLLRLLVLPPRAD